MKPLNARSSTGPRLAQATLQGMTLPLYVQEQGARVGKSGKNFFVKLGQEEINRFRPGCFSTCAVRKCWDCALHEAAEFDTSCAPLKRTLVLLPHSRPWRNAYDRAAQFAPLLMTAAAWLLPRLLLRQKAASAHACAETPPALMLTGVGTYEQIAHAYC